MNCVLLFFPTAGVQQWDDCGDRTVSVFRQRARLCHGHGPDIWHVWIVWQRQLERPRPAQHRLQCLQVPASEQLRTLLAALEVTDILFCVLDCMKTHIALGRAAQFFLQRRRHDELEEMINGSCLHFLSSQFSHFCSPQITLFWQITIIQHFCRFEGD